MTLSGVAAGVAVHPNTWNLLAYNWIVMVDVLFKNTWMDPVGFDMGAELRRYPLGGWIQGLSVSVLATLAAAAYGWRERARNPLILAFGLAALGFCVLTLRSTRFSEYFVPFSTAALALASPAIGWRRLAPILATLSLVYTLLVSGPTVAEWARATNPMPDELAEALRARIPPGSRVFTPSWYYTGLLMLALPERSFIVALDPTLFYLKDPERYRLWYRITHDPPSGLGVTIREAFGARYAAVFDPPSLDRFNARLSAEPGVRVLLRSEKWLVFDLGAPPPR